MSKLIEVKSVWKIYRNGGEETIALKDINLALGEGEYLAIVGPSGAGKSTLLHIMGGLDDPTEGNVLFGGKDIFNFRDRQASLWRNKSVGFVFQFYHLIEELNCLENVFLPSIARGVERKTSFKKAKKLLKYLGIQGKENFVPSQLSGGEKQKIAIARAFINEPKVVFCDEPTGNLDEDSQSSVVALLESLNKDKGKTLVVVTHNIELAKKANRVIYIRDGQIRDS